MLLTNKIAEITNDKYDKYNKYFLFIIIIILAIIIIRCLYLENIKKIETFELRTLENSLINNDNKDPKVYIYCEYFYNVMEDYILSFYKKLNAIVVRYDETNDIPKINSSDIYIFVKFIHAKQLTELDNNTKNVYLLNTEQLTIASEKNRINSYPKCVKMLDYNKSNFKHYDGYYTKLLQYQLNFDEIYNIPKTKLLCMMKPNGLIPEYRQIILDKLKLNNINIDLISGWKKERDLELFSYKILLNIGNTPEHKIFESIRCDRCLFNKMIIISDKKEDYDTYYYKDYIIFEDYDKIIDKVNDVINNYDTYYKKLGLDVLDITKLPIEPVSL